MIRILHVVGSMNMGGIETYIMNMYRTVNKSEIQFDFLVHTKEESFYDSEILAHGGYIYHISPRRNGIIKYIKELKVFFREKGSKYSNIHFHLSSLSNISHIIQASKYCNSKIILHGHSTSEGGKYIHKVLHKLNQERVEKYVDHYLACSNTVGNWMYGKRDFLVINNGIDPQKFAFSSDDRLNTRKKLSISDDEIVIGHVGSFSYAKNHKRIIDIFRDFHLEVNNSKLLLVGDGSDMKLIKTYVEKNDLKQDVLFLGIQKNVSPFLSAIDVLLMPSFYEGFPVSLVEAQSSGLPCIVSDSITKEVKLSNLVTFINLSESNDVWSMSIRNNLNKNISRFDYLEIMENSDFSLEKSIQPIINIYLDKSGGNYEAKSD